MGRVDVSRLDGVEQRTADMLEGLVWGLVFYTFALMVGLWCYRCYSPMRQRTFLIILLCCVGHYISTAVYSKIPSDGELIFFAHASPVFHRMGTDFVNMLTWQVRHFISGDSYIITLYFFSAFAFLGSLMWYLLFIQLAKLVDISTRRYQFPALIIMCWPSYLFFTAGVGKDSLCFFLIPVMLLSLIEFMFERKNKIRHLLVFVFSLVIVGMIRPYLFMIFAGAFILTNVKIKLSAGRLFLMLLMLPVAYYVVLWVLKSQANMSEVSVLRIASHAQQQQDFLSKGTSFPTFSKDPIIVLLCLPYGFIMNLTMPLFVFANNFIALVASVENSFLVWLVYKFFRNWQFFKIINRHNAVKLCFYFFVVGMAFMGLLNTNLGLATRQKSMYVPAFFVVAMLTWLCRKQKVREYAHIEDGPNHLAYPRTV